MTALGGCLPFLPASTAQAQLINLNGGEVMTCQFVNNTNVPNNQVYICVLANNAYLTPGGTMNAIVPGQNASIYTMTLAQIDALSPAGLQFPVMGSGRMWFSFYSPLNMPIVAGPGIVQPNIGNPTDPNINTAFDWMEFDEGSDYIYCNTTQVNMFGIPYTMGLYNVGGGLNGASGIADCYSDIVSKYEAYMNSIPGASIFNSLVGSVRIVAPADGTFAAGAANGTYFDNYISQLWTEYKSTPLVINTGGNTYSGTTTGPGSQMIFTGPGGPYYVGYPTTQDALAASGVFATGNPTELALEVVMAAGINRHVLDNAANLNNPAAFYQTTPCNYYSAFFHTVNLNHLAYGFPYDDDDNQSDLLVSTNARALAVTFSGCVSTPTSTFSLTGTSTSSPTASYTNTATSTSTSTPTATHIATSTLTPTNTVTKTATMTSTSSATNTATPTDTMTATSTSTSTNTLTYTNSRTPTHSPTATSINTATNTLSPTGTSTPTGTPTNTSTFTPTNTATNTATMTDTKTATNSATHTPTSSATNTATPTDTMTATSTSTSTNTLTYTNSRTPTHSPTATSINTATNTLSPTGTSTLTGTVTNTSTYTVTSTFTPTNTATLTNTMTATLTSTSTNTSTYTNSSTSTHSPTITNTATNRATVTFTNTLVSTATNTSTTTSTPIATSSAIPTSTNTLSPTRTSTPTGTPTVTSTVTPIRTPTPTSTMTPLLSATATVTPVNTLINTRTPTPTVPVDVFRICRNVFNETVDGTVCIAISSAQYPGQMTLNIYNSVGDHIKTLFDENLTQPLPSTMVNWDGTNKYGQKVASGVYIIYMIKPFGRTIGRLVVIR